MEKTQTMDKERGVSTDVQSVDGEAEHVNASGHRDQLRRHYGLLSICGAALNIDNAWVAFAGSVQVSLSNGGPPGVLYELLVACFTYFWINLSIAELASSIPSSGGVFHWASATPGKRWGRSIGWFAGWLNFFGWIFDLASIAYIPSNIIVQMYLTFHPDLVLQPYMTYVTFVGVMTLATLLIIFGNVLLPAIQHLGLFMVLAGGIITIIVVTALPAQHATNSFVWSDFQNASGWPAPTWFLTGVLNGAFTIGTPDSVTHLGEESAYPRRDLPRAIMAQVTLGTLYAFLFVGVAIFYGINDLDAVVGQTGSFALGNIYQQATGTAGGTFGLLLIALISIMVCAIGTVLTCSRILWTLARDNVVPFPGVLCQVNERLSCPIPATLVVYVLTLGFGAISLGSQTAFNDLVGSFIVLTTSSYLLAILPHLLSGRRNVPRGPFWLGKAGYLVNGLACLLIVFFDIFFCFPYVYPVDGDLSVMNWNSVILVGCATLAGAWWLIYGLRKYEGPRLPHLDSAGHEVLQEKD